MPNDPRQWYRRLFPTSHRLLLEQLVRTRLPKLEGTVLEVGAGCDPYGRYLLQATRVYTTDLVTHDGALDVVTDAHFLSFPDRCFDAVVALEVLEHLRDPRCAVNEILRVLRSGGSAVMSVPFMFHVHGDPFDYTRLTATGLQDLFGQCEVSIAAFGGRLHVISDVLTTVVPPAAAMRAFNHLLVFPGLRAPSSDCPSGYWLEAVKG